VRRLIDDDRTQFEGERAQTVPPLARTRRQEPLEHEAVAGKAGSRQDRDDGGRSGHGRDPDPGVVRGGDQEGSRVGDAGRAAVGDEGDVVAASQDGEHSVEPLALAEFVDRDHRKLEAAVRQELGGASGVFAGDERRACQDVPGARREIVQVSERCRDDVKGAGHSALYGTGTNVALKWAWATFSMRTTKNEGSGTPNSAQGTSNVPDATMRSP